tara:strand:- start:55 stop:621 length:567 start_codon:yes stop_codon:yes gene_type:complete
MEVYRRGGRNPVNKGSRRVKSSKLDAISDRQIAPIEFLLRRMALKKELKKGESKGDADDVNFDLEGGGGESCTEVDGKTVCFTDASAEELGEMATEDEKGDRKPFSLALADMIKGGRDLRQDFLRGQKKFFGKRRELDLDPNRSSSTMVRNPFARALYKRAQRKLAKSEGREDKAARGGFQIIKSPIF